MTRKRTMQPMDIIEMDKITCGTVDPRLRGDDDFLEAMYK